MKRIALAASAASLVLVTIAATRAAIDDSGGAQSAGPVPGTPTVSATRVSLPDTDVPTVDYTLDLETGLMTPLPEAIINSLGPAYVGGTSPYDPLWARYSFSPETSMLAYIGENPSDQSPQLFVAAIDGTGVRQLTLGPPGPICCAATPAWSPDGTKVVFDAPQGVYVVDFASGSLTQVVPPDFTKNYEHPRDPTFSPDGTRIIYNGDGVNATFSGSIRAVPVTGGPSTLLFGGGTGGMGEAGNASVSPDGTLVTATGNLGGSCCFRVLGNIDGTDMKPLGNLWGSNASGTWSPEGDRIVTRSDIDGIAVTDVATGKVEIVARGNGAIWLDDHTLLVEVS